MTTQWADLFPDVAATWHPSRNGRLTAGKVGRSWPDKVWWRCPAGHEWQETIASRVALPRWKDGNPAACRDCSGSPVALVTYTCPQCGVTRRVWRKNALKFARDGRCGSCTWEAARKRSGDLWEAAKQASEGAQDAAERISAGIIRDHVPPAAPAPLLRLFEALAIRELRYAIGNEQSGYKPGAIGHAKGALRVMARGLPPTIDQAADAAQHGGVLEILGQGHWAAGWVHHLTHAQSHPVSRSDLDEAAGLVAKLTENALPAAQPGWRTADTTGVLTHAIAELPRRVRYKYVSDNHWRTYRELTLPVLARGSAVRYGRLDLVIWHPEFPDIVVEIDSKPNPASARKLEFARDAGACPVWVRFGSGGITAPEGVAVIDLRSATTGP